MMKASSTNKSKKPTKKRKKPTRSKLVKKLDALYSKYIRLSKSDSKGDCICVTCGRKYHWKEIQNGHFISRSVYRYRRDDNNCRPQCVGCNVFKNGNYVEYTLFMIKNFGQDYVEEMNGLKHELYKISTPDIEELIQTYKDKVKELQKFKYEMGGTNYEDKLPTVESKYFQ